MLARLPAALIVLFWATMWVLLIRTELRPYGSVLREVPAEHVLKLMFRYERQSDLILRSTGDRMGRVRVTPRRRETDGMQVLELSGNLQIKTPEGVQRSAWDADFELDEQFHPAGLQMNILLPEPGSKERSPSKLHVGLNPVLHQLSYSWTVGERVVDAQTYSLDEAGLQALLNHFGLDGDLLKTAKLQATPPQITAQQSTVESHGANVETFLLTVRHNGQTLLECDVNQLGQVLGAKTILGWNLEVE